MLGRPISTYARFLWKETISFADGWLFFDIKPYTLNVKSNRPRVKRIVFCLLEPGIKQTEYHLPGNIILSPVKLFSGTSSSSSSLDISSLYPLNILSVNILGLMSVIISGERRLLLDIGLPWKGDKIDTLGRRVCDLSYKYWENDAARPLVKFLSRLLGHPRKAMGWCYSLSATPYGTNISNPTEIQIYCKRPSIPS